jgi:PPM family protein phosphatase
VRFTIFQATETGARSSNQDRMGYCYTSDSLLMVVADGMGGHLHGEIAAQLALQSIAGSFQRHARPKLEDPSAFLDAAVRQAHRDILRYQSDHGLPEAPRTTIIVCVVQDQAAWWAHAGDARLYWFRQSELRARTRDHSKVQSLVTMGVIDEADQDRHPERNKVLNCLGSPFEPTVEIAGRARLAPGDILLLCSDGLWSAHTDAALAQSFASDTVTRVVPALISHSLLVNGMQADNTTALAMAWEEPADLPSLDTPSLMVPDGAVTTTITYDLPNPIDSESALSDEDIDRSVREIQEAIARSTRISQ